MNIFVIVDPITFFSLKQNVGNRPELIKFIESADADKNQQLDPEETKKLMQMIDEVNSSALNICCSHLCTVHE